MGVAAKASSHHNGCSTVFAFDPQVAANLLQCRTVSERLKRHSMLLQRDFFTENFPHGQRLDLASLFPSEPVDFEKSVAGKFKANEIA